MFFLKMSTFFTVFKFEGNYLHSICRNILPLKAIDMTAQWLVTRGF